jgi:tetratricopeptide (TPR) repeat protein
VIGTPRGLAAAALAGCAAAALASPAAVGAARQRQVPSYGARVEVVRLHVAVLDDDGPVTDLTASDFTVVDNGVRLEVALALTPAEAPIDVVLAFDQSESIRQAAPTVKRDARVFLDALGPDDCALVLPFQQTVGPGLWGPSVAPALLDIIDLTSLEGGTSLNDALIVGLSEAQGWNIPDVLAARVLTEYHPPTIEGGVGIDLGSDRPAAPPSAPEQPGFAPGDLPFRVFPSSLGCGAVGADPDRRKALVVLTDGVDTTSQRTFGELLGVAHQTDAPVFPVLIGNPGADAANVNRDMRRAARVAEQRLETLAEITGGKLVQGTGAGARLRDAYDEIVTILRGSYLLGYYPRRSAADEAAAVQRHRIEVEVHRPGVEVFARTEYRGNEGDTARARSALRRGAAAIVDGRADEALAQAQIAVAADPEMGDGYMLAAAALWTAGREQDALEPLSRALWLAPGVPASHFLAWQLYYDLGDDGQAWRQAILAELAGADMQEPMAMLAQRALAPPDLAARLAVRRVFVEGPSGDGPEVYARLAGLLRALSRAVSDSPYVGLVRDPVVADYYLYVDAEDVDARRPAALESRLELYNYVDQRLWREDMDIDDLTDAGQTSAAVARAIGELEEWLREGR